jgi:hypothetical protein
VTLFISSIFVLFSAYKKLPYIKRILYQGLPKESYGLRGKEFFLPSKKFCILPVRAKIPKNTEEIFKKNCQIHKSLKSSRKIYALGNSYLEEKLPVILSFAKNYDLNLYYHVTPGVSYSGKNETWKFYLSTLPKDLGRGDVVVLSTPLRNVVSIEAFTKDLEAAAQQFHDKGIQLIFFGGGYPILKEDIVPWNCYQKWSKYNKKCNIASALDRPKNKVINDRDMALSRNKKINYISIYNEFETGLKNDQEPFRLYHSFNHITAYGNKYLINKILSYEKFNNLKIQR